jgi:hypothetical protein
MTPPKIRQEEIMRNQTEYMSLDIKNINRDSKRCFFLALSINFEIFQLI